MHPPLASTGAGPGPIAAEPAAFDADLSAESGSFEGAGALGAPANGSAPIGLPDGDNALSDVGPTPSPSNGGDGVSGHAVWAAVAAVVVLALLSAGVAYAVWRRPQAQFSRLDGKFVVLGDGATLPQPPSTPRALRLGSTSGAAVRPCSRLAAQLSSRAACRYLACLRQCFLCFN